MVRHLASPLLAWDLVETPTLVYCLSSPVHVCQYSIVLRLAVDLVNNEPYCRQEILWLHRYPIHYARDVPEGEPQRAWLFDEPIVIARRPGMTLIPSVCAQLGNVLCQVPDACNVIARAQKVCSVTA